MVKPKIKIKPKPKPKPKSRPKKPKEQIGRDLVKDTVGTNQLLDYNNLINILQKNIIIDDVKAKLYKENLDQQLKNQQYANDPNLQYQLKKVSKKLFKDLKDSIFKGDDDQQPIIQTTPKKQNKAKNISTFKQTIQQQVDENTKLRNIQTINKMIDKFLVNKSEKNITPTPELINKWKNKFSHLNGFKDDPNLNENFTTFVLSYFDTSSNYERDEKRRQQYIKLDDKYRAQRKAYKEMDKELNEFIMNNPEMFSEDDIKYIKTMTPKERETYLLKLMF
jgi:hypothetical protein